MEWQQRETYLYASNHTEKLHRKYACFDLDDTLITTKSHKKFPINKDDWRFNFKQVPTIIQELQQKRYNIVIISNQAGISKKENGIKDWQEKINNIVAQLNVPIIVYVALSHDLYRKPFPTFWKILTENKKVNLKKSFYCGDACGRQYDFSDSDLKFALNCKLKFCIPENIFNDAENIFPDVSYQINFDNLQKQQTENFEFTPNNKEMIMMVGIPGSGKSTYVQKYISPHNYEIINRDSFKTMTVCLTECMKHFKSGKSVVIDNTNPTIEAREKFITLAKKYNYQCRCFIMDIDFNLAKHNSYYRHYHSDGKINLIPEIVYNKYKKTYEEPNQKEGFESIIKIDFLFDNSFINEETYHAFYLTK